ncbi:hypothetical protein HG530_007016 [Fusarium avenaceum]|nr:hypothetical protein HG530_007016 [Fusarium avenaceum]
MGCLAEAPTGSSYKASLVWWYASFYPDETTSNGVADTSTDTTKQTRESTGDGQILMGDRSHDGDLVYSREDTSAKANEDLGKSQETNVGVWCSEGNDKGSAEQHDGSTSHGSPLDITRVCDPPTNQRCKDGGGERVGVEDVVGVGNAQPVDHLEVGAKLCLPHVEDGDQYNSKDLKGNDVRCRPDLGGIWGQAVGKKKARDASTQQYDANNVKLNKVELERLEERAVRPLARDDALLGGGAEHVDHCGHGRNTASSDDDGKGAKRPAEVEVLVESCGDLGTGKGGNNTGSGVDAVDECTVGQACHISQHNADDIHDTNVADPVENVGADVHLHGGASRLHNHADDADNHHKGKPFNSAPDINGFGQGKGSTSTNNGG